MSLDWTRYFALFWSEKYHSIYNRIRDLISIKSGVTYIIDRNCAKIKEDSYDFLPLEKTVMLWYLLRQFLIKIKITTTAIYSWKKLLMNYIKNTFLYKIQMIYYDRTDISGGIDVSKTSESRVWYLSLLLFFK